MLIYEKKIGVLWNLLKGFFVAQAFFLFENKFFQLDRIMLTCNKTCFLLRVFTVNLTHFYNLSNSLA